MALFNYDYTILTAFPTGRVDTGKLNQEVCVSVITIALDHITTHNGTCSVYFKASLPQTDLDILDALVAAHDGEPLIDTEPPTGSFGIPIVEMALPEGHRVDLFTPDFSKKETWYQASTGITGETLTDSGDLTTFNSANPWWVDVTHGKITQEHIIRDTYAAKVYVDAEEKIENPPGTTDGDYNIEHESGTVTFNSALTGTPVVTADYYYAESSLFIIKPPVGYIYRLSHAKVIMATNMVLNDTICYSLWGDAGFWGGPPGMMTMLGDAVKFQRVQDFFMNAEQVFPEMSVINSGVNWRHETQSRVVLRRNHADRATLDISNNMAMELWVELENHVPCGGDFAMAAFFFVKVPESL